MKFDVICVGSATCDIYLISDEFKKKKEGSQSLICQPYGGKVTVDKNVITTGGGATNAAVCFERLGLQAAVVACVGTDYWGKVIKSELEKEGVSLIYLQKTDKAVTSSGVALVGRDGGRTSLVYRAASNHLNEKQINFRKLNGRYLYVTSLGGDLDLFEKILVFARKKQIKLVLNPGGAELLKREELKKLIPFLSLLMVNREELETLLNKNKYDRTDIDKLGAKMVLVTNGAKGAKLYADQQKVISQKALNSDPVEVTGAGDSFGSSFVAGLIMGFSMKKSLYLAAINSRAVVEKIGPKEGLLFWPEAKKILRENYKEQGEDLV